MKRITITGKVVIGFLLMAIIMGIAIVFTYRALSYVTESVSIISEPNRKLQTWREEVRLLSIASASVQQWKISHSENELLTVDSCNVFSNEKIRKLYALNTGSKEAKTLTDSLAVLTDLWFGNLGQHIEELDTTGPDHVVVSNILREMALKEAMNPVITDTIADTSSLAANKLPRKKKYWGNIFHRKHDDGKTDTVRDPVIVVKKQQPAVIETSRIRNVITKGQFIEDTIERSRLLSEMALLKSDNAIMERVRTNSEEYEKIINHESEGLLQKAVSASAKGARFVASSLIGIAFLFMIFFVFVIWRDVRRDRLLKRKLVLARRNAENLSRAKEEFMANMSHEIRTPLNIISGFSSQLLKSQLDHSQRMQAESIYRSSDQLMAVVNDILDYSKMESGMFILEEIGFRTGDLVKDLSAAFEEAAAQKNVAFSVTVAGNVPPILTGDPVRLRQVLYNLISNAVKFTSEGSISVSISCETNLSGITEELCIRVTDTGIGISPEKKQAIFDAFVQADSSTTRRYGGTGLGLTISRYITEKMNGAINVESEEGSGSTFTVRIPLKTGTEKNLPELQQKNVMENRLKGKTILICDDEPLNRILASHMLDQQGATLLEAANGKEALDLLAKQSVDILLLDLQMPEMNGRETAKAIRANASYAGIRIIAVTGLSDEAEKARCLKEGMNGYLVKPFREDQLLSEISRLL